MKKFYELNDIQKVIVVNEMKDIMNENEDSKDNENKEYFALDSYIDIEELIYRLQNWKFEFNENELINMEVD